MTREVSAGSYILVAKLAQRPTGSQAFLYYDQITCGLNGRVSEQYLLAVMRDKRPSPRGCVSTRDLDLWHQWLAVHIRTTRFHAPATLPRVCPTVLSFGSPGPTGPWAAPWCKDLASFEHRDRRFVQYGSGIVRTPDLAYPAALPRVHPATIKSCGVWHCTTVLSALRLSRSQATGPSYISKSPPGTRVSPGPGVATTRWHESTRRCATPGPGDTATPAHWQVQPAMITVFRGYLS